MNIRKLSAAVTAGALLSCVGWNVASAQAPPGIRCDLVTLLQMVSLDNEVAIGIPDDEIGIVAGSEAALSGRPAGKGGRRLAHPPGHIQGIEAMGPRTRPHGCERELN